MGRTCVYVHHVDKDAFLKDNIDLDPDELDMVFDFCPSYAELLEQVRKNLNWMDPSDVVEFDASPPRINEEANIEPLSAQQSCIQHKPLLEDNDEHDDDENDGTVLHDNNLGDLNKYNLQETMDHSIPYSRGYAFESDDEGPDEEVDEEGFTAKEAEAFTKVLGRDHRTPLFEDLILADEAVVDEGEGILFGVRPPSHRDKHGKNIILPGAKFQTFLELKMWLDEYSVTHYRPHKVVHSNMKLRYTVACEDSGCPWIVRARPWKGGPGWNIVSCMPHTCRGKRVDGKLSSQNHRQLTSEFIAYRLSNSISSLPTMSIKSVQVLVKALFHYKVKYVKAWKAKQAAFKMLYGDLEQAYNRLPRLLGAIVATNPGMVHVVEPYGEKTRIHNGKRVREFGRAFWTFKQCVRAFQHCRPVISIDGTFLTGQFKGTLLVAIASDANNRLMPLAFALVEAENNINWEWFLHILRTKVLPFEREICVISDRHQGTLNAVDIVIPGHAPLHHRWCMRHFCANFYRACGSKELADDPQDCCQAFSDKRFARLYNALVANKKLDAGGLEFLNRHIQLRPKWARAYDEDGRRYGQMTSNMAECFNQVLKGVRALPVTTIVQYTFSKLRAYFLKYSQETDDQIVGENKKKYKYQFPPKVWRRLNPTRQQRSGGEEKDAAGEDQGLRERAAKKLREEDATEARKKKEEEYDARMKDELKIHLDHWRYEKRMKEQYKKMTEKRQKEFAASFNKMLAESTAKREREHQRFTERVMEEASKCAKGKRKRKKRGRRRRERGLALHNRAGGFYLMHALIFEPYALLNPMCC
ncbi:hypothetical protein D1007_37892 [Hordeum vulgare]|nr:hypothetical protein D1007_37892 [Hordeum vulgare]